MVSYGVVWRDVVEHVVVVDLVWCAVLCCGLLCRSLLTCTVVCCGVMQYDLVSCGGFRLLVGWFVGWLLVGWLNVWFIVDRLRGWFVGVVLWITVS